MEIALPHDFLESLAKTYGANTARQCAMSTSVGGIGPLLRERIMDQAAFGIDVVGVSLLYESVWVQTWYELGQLNLSKHQVGPFLRNTMKKTDLGFNLVMFDGETVPVEVWELNYNGARNFFLSSNPITDTVYPGPKDIPKTSKNPAADSHLLRLKQSWLVGRGGLELSKKLNRQPDLVVLSETPTLFGHHRISKDNYQNDPFFSETKYIFNDHTPLEYAHPIWDEATATAVQLDSALYNNTPAWNNALKSIDVTSFLVGLCEGVYGVAKKHGEVMKAMPSLHVYADKIQYVTNGVRLEDWQSQAFSKWETKSDAALLEIKKDQKKILVDWIWRHCRLWPTWATVAMDKKIVIWTRRITSYKRLDLLGKMLKNKDWRKRFLNLNIILLIGGRIHQQDSFAQNVMYELLDLLDKDDELQERIIPVDNFNVWEAPLLFKGTDACVMLADDTREASATGFMKGQMNGAAIIATSDGAVPEFAYFSGTNINAFKVPYEKGEPTSLGLLESLEHFVQATNTPEKSVAVLKSALSVTSQVSVRRTVEDMNKLYEQTLSLSDKT